MSMPSLCPEFSDRISVAFVLPGGQQVRRNCSLSVQPAVFCFLRAGNQSITVRSGRLQLVFRVNQAKPATI